ncbi:MAG: NB-ARC domain-containing protein [Rickettsiales bacterium]
MREGIVRLLSYIRENDCRYQIIDLEKYHYLTENDLISLNESIYNNHIIRRVKWDGLDELPRDHERFVKSIENKVSKNLLNYKYNPSHYEYALLSNDSYQQREKVSNFEVTAKEEALNSPMEEIIYNLPGWSLAKSFENNNTGFYSALYQNQKNCHMVIAYRGSEFKTMEFVTGDWQTNTYSIVLNKLSSVVGQVFDSYKTMHESVIIANDAGYKLSFTGHSLGGWLSNINAFFSDYEGKLMHPKSVTFDSPGIKQFIEKSLSNVENSNTEYNYKALDVTNYVSYPNLVNTIHKHVGKVIFIPTDIDKEHYNSWWLGVLRNVSFGYFDSAYSLVGHSLDAYILPKFNKTSGYPKHACEASNWPVVVGDNKSFYKDYIKDAALHKPDSNFIETILSQVEYNFIDNIPKFFGNSATISQSFPYLFGNIITGIYKGDIQYESFFEQYITTTKEMFDLNLHENCQYDDLDLEKKFEKDYQGHFKLSDVQYIKGALSNSFQFYEELLRDIKTDPERSITLRKLVKGIKEFAKTYDIQTGLTHGEKYYQITANEPYDFEYIQQYAKGIVESYYNLNDEIERHKQKPLFAKSHLPLSSSFFVGREKEFNLLEKAFFENYEYRAVLLRGVGGVGKSTLAIEWAHALIEESPYIALWFSADDKIKLETTLQEYSRELEYGYRFENKDNVRIIKDLIPKFTQNNYLIILDNVERCNDIKDYFIHMPTKVKFLITTRNSVSNFLECIQLEGDLTMQSDNKNSYFSLSIESLDSKAIREYLHQTLEGLVEKANIEKLLMVIGDSIIPQKLQEIVYFVKERKDIDITEIISEIEKGIENFQQFLFKKLMERDPEAWDLLQYLAYLNPELDDPKNILLNISNIDKKTLNSALLTLKKHSLIDEISGKEDNSILEYASIRIHRLIQEEILSYQQNHEELNRQNIIEKIAVFLDDKMPLETFHSDHDEIQEKMDEVNKYIGSVINFLEVVEKRNLFSLNSNIANLLSKVGKHITLVGLNLESALEYHQKALLLREAINDIQKDDISLLKVAHSLQDIAQIYYEKLEFKQGEEYILRARDIYVQLGEYLTEYQYDAIETVWIRGYGYFRQGDYNAVENVVLEGEKLFEISPVSSSRQADKFHFQITRPFVYYIGNNTCAAIKGFFWDCALDSNNFFDKSFYCMVTGGLVTAQLPLVPIFGPLTALNIFEIGIDYAFSFIKPKTSQEINIYNVLKEIHKAFGEYNKAIDFSTKELHRWNDLVEKDNVHVASNIHFIKNMIEKTIEIGTINIPITMEGLSSILSIQKLDDTEKLEVFKLLGKTCKYDFNNSEICHEKALTLLNEYMTSKIINLELDLKSLSDICSLLNGELETENVSLQAFAEEKCNFKNTETSISESLMGYSQDEL